VDLASSVQLVSIKKEKKKKISPQKGGIRKCFKFNGFFKMYVCVRPGEGGG